MGGGAAPRLPAIPHRPFRHDPRDPGPGPHCRVADVPRHPRRALAGARGARRGVAGGAHLAVRRARCRPDGPPAPGVDCHLVAAGVFAGAGGTRRTHRIGGALPGGRGLRGAGGDRHQSRFPAAGPHGAGGVDDAARTAGQRRQLAEHHLAARRGGRTGNGRCPQRPDRAAGRLPGGSSPPRRRPGGARGDPLPRRASAGRRRIALALAGRRAAILPPPAGAACGVDARPVVGAVRRRGGAAADLRGRHPAQRSGWTRPAPCRARRGGGADVGRHRVASAVPARRTHAADRGVDLRRGDDRFRAGPACSGCPLRFS